MEFFNNSNLELLFESDVFLFGKRKNLSFGVFRFYRGF
ncbi:hypothetical protein LEP1GSC059_3955 [Leptospira noguchii serovar Panama str. CZ214]|uniref:Uncharacterized protein n=1 Tax=Leptospira noguchii serovar Panama str. CZ214 TaxID=1001595 RepID=T0FUJ0_9LEPT|nr:hypothetical protein LEP1GSC059_3955 [Leptospira noguchii serovar Panama str. CZ214]